MGEFGQKFRKARETRELSFDDVSNVIKIGPKMLRAIEDENFDQLPGGVFNKGFIRAYAKHLGLNPEEAIAEYQSRLREIQQARIEAQQGWRPDSEKAPAAAAKTPVASRQSSVTVAPPPPVKPPAMMQPPRPERRRTVRTPPPKPPTEIPWRLVAVAVVVVALGILLWTRPHALNMSAIKPSAIHPAPSDSSTSTSAPATPQPTPPASAPTQSTPSSPAAQPATPTPGNADNEDKNDVTVRTFDKPAAKPVPLSLAPAAGSFTLIVRASENSWVSVTADGQLLAQETLIAPAHPSFHASREFVVKVGNAAAISFVVNGKEIAPQGGESEVRTLVFDSSGLKSAPTTSN